MHLLHYKIIYLTLHLLTTSIYLGKTKPCTITSLQDPCYPFIKYLRFHLLINTVSGLLQQITVMIISSSTPGLDLHRLKDKSSKGRLPNQLLKRKPVSGKWESQTSLSSHKVQYEPKNALYLALIIK